MRAMALHRPSLNGSSLLDLGYNDIGGSFSPYLQCVMLNIFNDVGGSFAPYLQCVMGVMGTVLLARPRRLLAGLRGRGQRLLPHGGWYSHRQ